MSKQTIIVHESTTYTIHRAEKGSRPWFVTGETDGEYTYFEPFKLKRDAVAFIDSLYTSATPEVATPEVATPEVATPEVATPEPVSPAVESWDWIRANGIEVPTVTPVTTPVNYAAKMSADLSPATRVKILPAELIACALLLIMLIVGSALVMPVAISFAIAAIPAIKLAGVAIATTLISGSLLV